MTREELTVIVAEMQGRGWSTNEIASELAQLETPQDSRTPHEHSWWQKALDRIRRR